jgi:hypothetical protein
MIRAQISGGLHLELGNLAEFTLLKISDFSTGPLGPYGYQNYQEFTITRVQGAIWLCCKISWLPDDFPCQVLLLPIHAPMAMNHQKNKALMLD